MLSALLDFFSFFFPFFLSFFLFFFFVKNVTCRESIERTTTSTSIVCDHLFCHISSFYVYILYSANALPFLRHGADRYALPMKIVTRKFSRRGSRFHHVLLSRA